MNLKYVPVSPRRSGRGALAAAFLAGMIASPACCAAPAHSAMDFRYAPPEWQISICLPDDPNKTLVDKTGELLYH